MVEITIDTTKIIDWASFHQAFKNALGFPDFYGNNMDAWIDCLSDLHGKPGLCNVGLVDGEILCLYITDTTDFNQRQSEMMNALVECAAFVNYRWTSAKEQPRLALIFLNSG